ncbi:tRNA modification GTPase MnmE [Candidatus Providencia siddallii]|uniref:tRNA modification GTPase MnmE n=1 Tax=Candidatus Providencia siddallii TaxID=1715285 RepID=A0ABM9NNC0_9GAMM
MKYINDTIVAQITPVSRGGVGIIRVSGCKVKTVSNKILKKIPKPRYADYIPFFDDNDIVIDHGIAIYFPSPNSFTGEDVLELHGHGGLIVLNLILKRILDINEVRIANPGEFCERAFLNKKIDLIQAEAISDLIEANSEQAVRSAIKSLQGVFSSNIYKLVNMLKELRIYIEGSIDFSEQENTYLLNNEIKYKLNKIILFLKNILSQTKKGILLREGINIVIAGSPNAGKSSLLNTLVGSDVAIVTDIAGTTRDILCEHIYINGIQINIFDSAGLCNPNNEVERIGVERALNIIKRADRILYVVDSTVTSKNEFQFCSEFIDCLSYKIPITIIRNKIDLTGEDVKIENKEYPTIYMSVRECNGINILYEHLKSIVSFNNDNEGVFIARERHLQALKSAYIYLSNCYEEIITNNSYELIAEELRLAQNELNKITGKYTSDDLLHSIFSNFCIGK